MSDIERRIESLGRRIGTVAAATKLRARWGPTIQIHIRESVGGRILGPAWRLVENARQTVGQKARYLHKLMETRFQQQRIMRYVRKKYGRSPALDKVIDGIHKDGGIAKVLGVLERMNPNALVFGSPEFDAELFDLISEPGDEIKVDGKVIARKEFVPFKEGNAMGTITREIAIRHLAELKAQKRLRGWLEAAVPRGGNDIYKDGGDELIVDMFQIFYDEVLNAPSSNYVQKKRDPSQFPRLKKAPKQAGGGTDW